MLREIEYVPPSPAILDSYARSVCERLGGDYCKPEVVRGFSEFLRTISEIYCKQLNRAGSQLDT